MRRVWRWAWLPAVAALVLLPGAAASVRGAAASQTFTVDVDGTPKSANLGFDTYFPKATTIHAGDTVKFHWAGVGEPHTTTFGTYVDAAVLAYNHLTPAQQQSNNPPKAFLAIDARVPNLFPQGPGDATQSVSNPCYQQSRSVGTNVCPNSQHEQPDFNGTQVYYNSGWPDSGQSWSMRFSSATAPGQYRFMCALHREGMSGKITVAPAGKTIMSPAAQFALGQKQLARDVAPLVPAVAATRQGRAPIPGVTVPGANHVLAGSGLPNGPGAIYEFGPKSIKIPVGGSVTWWVIGGHSITFNSDKSNDDIRAVAPDGTVHGNQQAGSPVNSPGQPQSGGGGGGKGISFKVVASKTWDGQGFLNTGLWFSFPPVIDGYKLTFTKAGTYHYLCVIHDNMKGTVVVG
jgi:plastocyanin